MLGKLFSSLPTPLSSRRNIPSPGRDGSLDSVQEEIHTRSLLFPDPEALYQHQHDQLFPMSSTTTAGSGAIGSTSSQSHFDITAETGVELGDIRVLVMQEATSSFSASTLMCDSHALADIPPSPTIGPPGLRTHRGSISNQRRTSVGQNATSKPVIITQDGRGGGAFDRRPSTHGRSNSIQESEGERSRREYREDIGVCANCMFGASDVMAYKGTGIKLHILGPEYRSSGERGYGDWEGRQSLGRGSLRRSGLGQSYTSQSGASTSTTTSAGRGHTSERKRVLLTRIFPVQLPSDESDSPLGSTDHLGTSYPFPKSGQEAKKGQPKQKRTPMYSIGLIIQLPTNSQQTSPRNTYRSSVNPGSYTEPDSISSSFNSTKPTWSLTRSGSGFGVDSMESSFSYDGDEKFDIILQHYDIIIRTMNRLQAEVTAELLKLLRQQDLASPDPLSLGRVGSHHRTASISVSGKRVEESNKPIKPVRTNVKCVQLMPYALANNQKVGHEVNSARQRVLGGICNLQVVTRQGRWGIWRDEARWVAKWAGSKEQGFFFYNVLTAFLGVHTEWLEAIGPTEYRRRHYRKNRTTIHNNDKDDVGVRSRTIVISKDKMATRRLIFLLSAFLPNNQQGHASSVSRGRSGRSGRSESFMGAGGYSQSPPSLRNSHKEESLLKQMNKSSVGKAANAQHPRHLSFPASLPKPRMEHNFGRRDDVKTIDNHSRRASDAHILPPALPGLPAGSSNLSISSRADRETTTSTSDAMAAAQLAPGSARRRTIRGTGPAPRPGSSGSLATDNLLRELKRDDAAGGAPRWKGMLGGMWGMGRKGSVSKGSGASQSSAGLNVPGGDHYGSSPKNKSMLGEMNDNSKNLSVAEAAKKNSAMLVDATTSSSNNKDKENAATTTSSTSTAEEHSAPQAMKSGTGPSHGLNTSNTPPSYAPVGSQDSPVKTSIDANGTINVDFQLPTFLTQTFSPPSHNFHEEGWRKQTPSSVGSSGILSTFEGGGGGGGGGGGRGGVVEGDYEGFEQYTRCGGRDEGGGTNVGGWLQQWHPDFVVQGIPSCTTKLSELEEEVRASMAAESTPLISGSAKGKNEDGQEERWITVATSLIANTNDWTIKRLTLSRLVRVSSPERAEYKPVTPSPVNTRNNSSASAHPTDDVAGSYESRSGMSIYGNPYADMLPIPTGSTLRGTVAPSENGQEVIDERWEDEMCIAFDELLVQAVEKVIHQVGAKLHSEPEPATPVEVKEAATPKEIRVVIPAPKSGESSRHASRPASRSASKDRRKPQEEQNEVPRGEVRAVLLGALECLAREVADDREKRKEQEENGLVPEGGCESMLKEGINAWLEEVDS